MVTIAESNPQVGVSHPVNARSLMRGARKNFMNRNKVSKPLFLQVAAFAADSFPVRVRPLRLGRGRAGQIVRGAVPRFAGPRPRDGWGQLG